MSRKYKTEYQSFYRNILKEFLSHKELKRMDREYNKAKIKRAIRRLELEAKGFEMAQKNK